MHASRQDQSQLGSDNAENKLLQYRGNAGTHDLALGADSLKALRDLSEPGAKMQVPRSVPAACRVRWCVPWGQVACALGSGGVCSGVRVCVLVRMMQVPRSASLPFLNVVASAACTLFLAQIPHSLTPLPRCVPSCT